MKYKFLSPGQILRHEILEDNFYSKVPSLKTFNGWKSNGGSKYSSMRKLAEVTLFLQRFVLLRILTMNEC